MYFLVHHFMLRHNRAISAVCLYRSSRNIQGAAKMIRGDLRLMTSILELPAAGVWLVCQ